MSSEKIVEMDIIFPRGLFDKNELKKNKKITNILQKNINTLNIVQNSSKIPIRVVLNYNTTEEEFENAINLHFNYRLNYSKYKTKEYDFNVNVKELNYIKDMNEVLFITKQDNETPNYIIGEPIENENGISLNASSEMTGTVKARKDFKVTGDLDGKETEYSTNDVVIAVVDSGIDETHVDLDEGKVIGWYDAVNNKSDPYDDHGHGTHIASIAAGTGEGDPGIEEGFAPGAALVGVKVVDEFGSGSNTDLVEGLQWVYDNIDEYSIDVVNMSIGSHQEESSAQDIIDLINDISIAGVPVFVSAGNEGDGYKGHYYDTLSIYAEKTATSVGSIKDPYEGGWGLSKFSSRGTDDIGPYIVSTGENIRAAKANSKNEYITYDGTSMATPTVAGIFALMYDAAYSIGGGTIKFYAADMGEEDFDKNYGGGRLLAYKSIKEACNESGKFDTYRSYIVDQNGYVDKGKIVMYPVKCNSSEADLNVTLIITDENNEDLDIVIWKPGSNPYDGDASDIYINEEDELPQECVSIEKPDEGMYYIGVFGNVNSANYTLEITGHELEI